jgi:hypothetical protein
MGTWGSGILDDDFAQDVRRDYLERLAAGEKPAAASKALVASYGELDSDEAPVFWLALAATQWEYGALDATVKRRALAVIAREDSPQWKGDKRRAAALAKLAAKLAKKPPKPKRPRLPKPPEIEYAPVPSPDGTAIASVSEHAGHTQVGIEIPSLGGGGGIFAATRCPLGAVELRWRGNAKLEVRYPATAKVEKDGPIGDPEQFYLSGRTIALTFVKTK